MNKKLLMLLGATAVLSAFGQAEQPQQDTGALDQPAATSQNAPLVQYYESVNPANGYSGGWSRMPLGQSQVLVVNSGGSDQKNQETLEVDLPIMWHLLSNAAGKRFGAAPNERRAMGINVVFAPGASPIHSLYLDGYGVLFLLNVDFPLLPPPKSPAVQKENPRTDSAWEEARHEIYGQPASAGRATPGPAEEYDEQKVNSLKSALLEALKSATNIRGLRPDDSITVCVSGWASGADLSEPGFQQPAEQELLINMLGPGQAGSWRRASAPVHAAILNMRVKKADVDAFASGKLNAEEFRKKANVTVYLSQSGGLGAPISNVRAQGALRK